MKKKYLKKIPYRIIAFFCAVLILFLSPYVKYVDASSIPEVHASAEVIGVGALGAGAIAKWLAISFGAVGAGEAYYRFEDEINASFYDYISAPGESADELMKIANVNAGNGEFMMVGTTRPIGSDALTEWVLGGGAATAAESLVDSLTDLYVQFAPSLLMDLDGFMSGVLSGDLYIDGFTDELDASDLFVNDTEIAKQRSGSLYNYAYSIYTSQTDSVGTMTQSINASRDYTYSVAGYKEIDNGIIVLTIKALNRYGSTEYWSGNGIYKRVNALGNVFTGTSISSSYSVPNTAGNFINVYGNFPIFASAAAAEAYLLSGVGYAEALNYYADTMYTVIDLTKVPDLAPDIPPFTKSWQVDQWGEASDVILFPRTWEDFLGADLPFWALSDFDEFARSIQDIFDKSLEGIFDGTDVITFPTTYDDVWDDVFTDAWERVRDGALDIPVDDTQDPAISVPRPYPWERDKTENPDIDTDIPVDDVIDIPIEDIVPSVSDSFFDVAGSLRYKFPFSIPWDIQYMLSCLASTPKAPRFELPLIVERYGINEKIIIDMEMFQTLSNLSRSLFSMLFAIFLVNLTFKVVGMRKEE